MAIRFGPWRSTFLALCTFCSLALLLSLFHLKDGLQWTKNEHKIAIELKYVPKCFANTVLAKPSLGRLGNQLMQYASAWSLAQLFNLTLLIADSTKYYISPLFSNMSAIPVAEFVNELGERNPECRNLDKTLLLKQSATPLDNAHEIDQQVKITNSTGPVLLRPYIVLSSTIAVLQTIIKKEFNYRSEFWNYAHSKLRKAAASLKRNGKNEQILHVGVHVRRTDYSAYLQNRFGTKVAITDVNYYTNAMEYMLKRLMDKEYFKVVFSVVSDDKRWSTKKLIPALISYLQKYDLDKNVTVIWNGSKNYMNDLALLSACNHSIISYGTFGAWSALMAGGLTVVFDIDRYERKGVINSAMSFAKHLPNWTIM